MIREYVTGYPPNGVFSELATVLGITESTLMEIIQTEKGTGDSVIHQSTRKTRSGNSLIGLEVDRTGSPIKLTPKEDALYKQLKEIFKDYGVETTIDDFIETDIFQSLLFAKFKHKVLNFTDYRRISNRNLET